ncbi:hypothetical protein [Plantibacter sp. CFBP 8775]|uniref:hypothetical protein n=1 Tax=Plantibacter sp. CFBP 8775 TaxID=2774038 RepID=UPI00177EBD84|nr:hypothetical protein [Plantibacter sp. CFBP 8775]MBD8104062.1 hypothetical protein [Plantibacter sp. CFBP 8775]
MKTSRRAAALTTGLAVVAGSTLLLAGPASAAEIQVTDDQVAANETVYTGWHEGYGLPGSTTPPGADAVVTEAGLDMTGPSQIINGLAAPLAVNGTTATFATIAATAGVVSTNNLAYFQIPVYAETGVTTSFTTLRPENPGAAGLTGNWVASSDDIAGIAANTPTSIADLSAALGSFDLLAFGVLVIADGDDVVQTISFNGDNYNFAAPVVAPVFDPLVVVDPDTIYFSDVRPGGAGFAVTVTGFTPGDTLTISVIDPNGEVFGSADGGDTVIADADGGFAAADLTFVGEGIQVGTYTFRVTDSAGVFAEDAIAVIADPVAAGAPVVPTLADTGLDSGVLVGGAAALLLLGAAGMLFAAARRKGAQVTA